MEIVVGALAAWGLLMLIWTLAGVLLLPVSRNSDTAMTVVLCCRGDARGLERQLRGLVWLRDSGLLWWDILILDLGMDQDAKANAERLADNKDNVVFMNMDEVKEWMEQHDGQ